MNAEKLKLLQDQVRIGGKGTVRRKKKVVHRNVATDSDKKLQSSLKKLSVNSIPGIEEVNMIKDDGTVINFINPKVQASLPANTFAITGYAQIKQMTQMLPGILNQLGAENLSYLKRIAGNVGAGAMDATNNMEDENEEVPDLVENFDEVAKNETGAGEPAKISSNCCGGAHNHDHKEENDSKEKSEIPDENGEIDSSINGHEVVTETHNHKEENDSNEKSEIPYEKGEDDASLNGFEVVTEADNLKEENNSNEKCESSDEQLGNGHELVNEAEIVSKNGVESASTN